VKQTPLPVINSCDNCGACCTGQAALPIHLVSKNKDTRLDPVSPLPPELASELQAIIDGYMANNSWPDDGSPCIWYDADTRRCKHYTHRPILCRDAVKVGDESCRRWRRSTGVDSQHRYTISSGNIIKL
jgi:Fe-S-cluster containining protein